MTIVIINITIIITATIIAAGTIYQYLHDTVILWAKTINVLVILS